MGTSMACGETADRMMDLLYGELDGEARAALDAHIAGCDRCRRELDGFLDTRGLVRRAPDEEPPAAVRSRLLDAARAAAAGRASRRRQEGKGALWSRLRRSWQMPTFVTVGAVAVLVLASRVFLEPERTVERGRAMLEPEGRPARAPAGPRLSAPLAAPAERTLAADDRETAALSPAERDSVGTIVSGKREEAENHRQSAAPRGPRSLSLDDEKRERPVAKDQAAGAKSDSARGVAALEGRALPDQDGVLGQLAVRKDGALRKQADPFPGTAAAGPTPSAAANDAVAEIPSRAGGVRSGRGQDSAYQDRLQAKPKPSARPALEPIAAPTTVPPQPVPARSLPAPAPEVEAPAAKHGRAEQVHPEAKQRQAPQAAHKRQSESALAVLIDRADRAFGERRFREARDAYQELVRRFPGHADLDRWRKRVAACDDGLPELRPGGP